MLGREETVGHLVELPSIAMSDEVQNLWGDLGKPSQALGQEKSERFVGLLGQTGEYDEDFDCTTEFGNVDVEYHCSAKVLPRMIAKLPRADDRLVKHVLDHKTAGLVTGDDHLACKEVATTFADLPNENRHPAFESVLKVTAQVIWV